MHFIAQKAVGHNKKLNFIITVYNQSDNPGILYKIGKELIRSFDETSLHWTLSSLDIDEMLRHSGEDFIENIRNRVRSGRDSLFMRGFAGGYHSLLEGDELKKEISWGLINPWGTGIQDVFKTKPGAYFPISRDRHRFSVRKYYASSPYIWLEAKVPGINKTGIITASNSQSTGSFPALFFDTTHKQKIRKIFQELHKTHAQIYFVCINTGDKDCIEKTALFLEALSRSSQKGREGHPVLFTPSFITKHQGIPFIKEHSVIPHTPFYRSCRKEGLRARFAFKENAADSLLKTVLLTHSRNCRPPLIGDSESEIKDFSVSDRSLIANMPGTVSIAEKKLEIQLENGRLCSVLDSGKPVISGEPVRSYIEAEKKSFSFQQSNTFSFEDENSRGLREVAVLAGENPEETGQTITDYFFVEDRPALFVSIYVQYPFFRDKFRISAFAPLEISLFTLQKHEHISVKSFFPGGESYTQEIRAVPQITELSGKTFCISKGEKHIYLSFPGVEDVPIHLLPFKILKEKNGFRFYCNPMGSYRSCTSSEISGWGEHFTLILQGRIGENPSFTDLKEDNFTFLEPAWIRKCKNHSEAGNSSSPL